MPPQDSSPGTTVLEDPQIADGDNQHTQTTLTGGGRNLEGMFLELMERLNKVTDRQDQMIAASEERQHKLEQELNGLKDRFLDEGKVRSNHNGPAASTPPLNYSPASNNRTSLSSSWLNSGSTTILCENVREPHHHLCYLMKFSTRFIFYNYFQKFIKVELCS